MKIIENLDYHLLAHALLCVLRHLSQISGSTSQDLLISMMATTFIGRTFHADPFDEPKEQLSGTTCRYVLNIIFVEVHPFPVPHENTYGRMSKEINSRHTTSRHFLQRSNQLSMGCIAENSRQQVLTNPKN